MVKVKVTNFRIPLRPVDDQNTVHSGSKGITFTRNYTNI